MQYKIKIYLKDGSAVLMDKIFDLDIPKDLGITLEDDLAWDKAMWPVSEFFVKLSEVFGKKGGNINYELISIGSPPCNHHHHHHGI